MHIIASGFGHKITDGAGAVSVLRRVVQCKLLEFLNRLFDGGVDVSAAQAFVGNSIDEETIEVLAQPIYYRAVPILEIHSANINRTRIKTNQVVHIATVEGQVLNLS